MFIFPTPETQSMRFWMLPALFLAFLLLLPSIAQSWSGEVAEVIDADILRIKKGESEVEVRLYGIDAPESDQPYGMRATRFTSKPSRGGFYLFFFSDL